MVFLRKIGRGIKSVGRGVAYILGFFVEVLHVIGQGIKAVTAIFD